MPSEADPKIRTVRVTGTVINISLYRSAVVLSAVLWTLAFVLFVIRYLPILTKAEIDGK